MNYSNSRHSGARRLARAKMCNCTSKLALTSAPE
jgi:hypothetical protein